MYIYVSLFVFEDPLIGCEDCQCRIEGVINGRLDCDLRTGQCPCRENIGSRTCDRCAPGLGIIQYKFHLPIFL
jgi:hypothetical protein